MIKKLVVTVGALSLIAFSACTKKSETETPMASQSSAPAAAVTASGASAAAAPGAGAVRTLPDGLKIEDVKVGTGAEAVAGKTVTVHYTGTLTDGKKFDSSRDHGQPFTFPLGAGRVIKGWDEGVAGMKVGGVRKLTIPSDLGYGPNGMGPIPPNATLLFDVELLDVK